MSVRERKANKKYVDVIGKVKDITNVPTQELRNKLIDFLTSVMDGRGKSHSERQEGSIDELNRIRDHLELTLGEVVSNNKKNDHNRKVELSKRIRENTELLQEINELRTKIRTLE